MKGAGLEQKVIENIFLKNIKNYSLNGSNL